MRLWKHLEYIKRKHLKYIKRTRNLLVLLLMTLLLIFSGYGAMGNVVYDRYIKVGFELYALLTGWFAGGAYSKITFAYDCEADVFILDSTYTYAENWVKDTWWSYASIKRTSTSLTTSRLYDYAEWEVGYLGNDEHGYNKIVVWVSEDPVDKVYDIVYFQYYVYHKEEDKYYGVIDESRPHAPVEWVMYEYIVEYRG
ncbi:MAG: hypothetical protein DRJ66_01220 [Thermoprotei archaeon]|nr:MAG: hypothetical protein DRJ66_01220 [Thermoprotei archaeon]